MNVMVILNHPYRGSFNYAIYEAAAGALERAGHAVDRLHLDEEDFDPVMRAVDLAVYADGGYADPKVAGYQERLSRAEHLVLVFPVWWEVMPALLKGFLDKVLTKGWAFNARGRRLERKLTHIRGATVITTMNTPRLIYGLVFKNAVKMALVRGTLRKCGVGRVTWINLSFVNYVSSERRAKWLADIERHMERVL